MKIMGRVMTRPGVATGAVCAAADEAGVAGGGMGGGASVKGGGSVGANMPVAVCRRITVGGATGPAGGAAVRAVAIVLDEPLRERAMGVAGSVGGAGAGACGAA
jgi:hypothetical protein